MAVGTTKKVVENKRLYKAVILEITALFSYPLYNSPYILRILLLRAPASFSGSFTNI
jgi:hypothetical protein